MLWLRASPSAFVYPGIEARPLGHIHRLPRTFALSQRLGQPLAWHRQFSGYGNGAHHRETSSPPSIQHLHLHPQHRPRPHPARLLSWPLLDASLAAQNYDGCLFFASSVRHSPSAPLPLLCQLHRNSLLPLHQHHLIFFTSGIGYPYRHLVLPSRQSSH